MDIVDKIAMERTGKTASTCIRRWIETGLQQGRQEGVQEGVQQGVQLGKLNCIKLFIHNKKIRGISDMEIKYDLVNNFGLSEEEASKILFEP